MASAAARSVFRSASVRNAAARFASEAKAARSPFRVTSRKPLSHRIFTCPAEMSACVGMQPFHSATASALMTSMLSISRRSYGWLSEAYCDHKFHAEWEKLKGLLGIPVLGAYCDHQSRTLFSSFPVDRYLAKLRRTLLDVFSNLEFLALTRLDEDEEAEME